MGRGQNIARGGRIPLLVVADPTNKRECLDGRPSAGQRESKRFVAMEPLKTRRNTRQITKKAHYASVALRRSRSNVRQSTCLRH